MKITLDYAMGDEVIEADKVTITNQVLIAGERIIATPVLDHGQLVWKDERNDRLIGAITVEASE